MSSLYLLLGCKQNYTYDLIKIKKLEELSDYSSVKVTPSATPIKRLWGAIIKSGAPYTFSACFDAETEALPEIKNVSLVKLFEGKDIAVDYQTSITEWLPYGGISCIDNIATFDDKIESASVYCLNLYLKVSDGIEIDKFCWQFKRVLGEGEMTFQDILNQ